jgi:diaminohydroxyphosphoribosylaminopyrimidine deaminase/5-amino-6-(5-phosphoribosylamino)uracil reductase
MKKAISLPLVSVKMAQSLDGKITTHTGESKWITSEKSRAYVQKLRALHDAILVGKNTAIVDNPSLNLRGENSNRKQPWRIVLDPHYQLKANSKVFNLDGGRSCKTIRVVFESVLAEKKIDQKKSFVILPAKDKQGRIDLKSLLRSLKGLGVESILVEGGGETAWSFISEKLVQKVYWFVAPKFIGGKNALTSLEGCGVKGVQKAIPVKNIKIKKMGCDFLVEGNL